MSSDSDNVDNPMPDPSGSADSPVKFRVGRFYSSKRAKVYGPRRRSGDGARPRVMLGEGDAPASDDSPMSDDISEGQSSSESAGGEGASHETAGGEGQSCEVSAGGEGASPALGAGGDGASRELSDGDEGPSHESDGEGARCDGGEGAPRERDSDGGGDAGSSDGGARGGDGERPSDGDRADGESEGDGDRRRGRRRSRKPETWVREVAKAKRNLGQAYHSPYTGDDVRARVLGTPCRDGCFAKVGQDQVKAIFARFWALGNFEAQTNYIIGRVKPKAIKRKRTANVVSRRSTTNQYSVHYQGTDYPICKEGFAAMHGISKRKVEYALSTKKTDTGTAEPDKHGRQTPQNKIAGDRLAHVHEHINMLPVTSSHYTRAKSPNRKYLGSEGSIPQLYSKYKEWLHQAKPGQEPVNLRFYRTVFSEEYNIGFEPPKKDVCTTCGRLETLISRKNEEGLDATAVQEELRLHQTRYRRARQELQTAKTDPDPFRMAIVIDLQQTLPCPRLTVGQAYYKRKLWVYNFAVTNLKDNKTTLFVWDESTAGRGSSEVSSCILRWLDMTLGRQCVDGRITPSIFADNCAGQNKNLQMVLMGLRELHSLRLTRVEFSFLVSGHSYLPCDAVFGHIELEVQRCNIVMTPEEYRNIIATCVTPPYAVVHMVRENFLDVNFLLGRITKRKVAGRLFSSAAQIVVAAEYKEGYLLKPDYDTLDAAATKVRVMQGMRRFSAAEFNLAREDLPLKYASERLLQKEKVDDLEALRLHQPYI